MSIKTASGTAKRPHRRGVYLRVSPPRLAIFGVLLLGSWVAIWLGGRAHGSTSLKRPSVKHAARSVTRPATRPAPWGTLEFTRIDLSPPPDAAERFASVDTGTWYFRDCDPAKLAQTLESIGMPAEQRDRLLKSCSPEPIVNGLIAKPEPSLVRAFSPDVRTALYRILAAEARNPQAEPFRHRFGNDWFAASGLPDEAVLVARRLLYRRGVMEAFVDVGAMSPYLKSEDDRAALFRTLCSQSALLVMLRVWPDSDLDALTSYWGAGGRERQVRPLLESLKRLPEGGSISVAQLMPHFARSRIYTFPQLEGTSANGPQDCHWTTFNFWNLTPNDGFSQAANVGSELATAYHPIEIPRQLGDVVFFLNEKGEGVHSAVYVADDVVFTKNGSNMAAPWIFMHLPDLLTYYEAIGATKTVYFRKNVIEEAKR